MPRVSNSKFTETGPTRPPAGTALLTIGKAGAGTGTVTSTPSGIDCGPACAGATAAFTAGTVVSLTATPAEHWVFVGWSGEPDCADGVVALTAALTCQATFTAHLPLFAKQAPMHLSTWASRTVTLAWTAAPNATYLVCWDTTNNNACDTGWQSNGEATTRVLESLAAGTYYWQVKTVGGTEDPADDGTWWRFTVSVPEIPADHWTAEYYANPSLTAPAAAWVDDGAGFLRHDWGYGSPTGLPRDHFSARYTRTVTVPAGRYRFFVLTDDGSRLWVDGALVVDAWHAMTGPTPFTTVLDLAAGAHTLRFECGHGVGNATARLSWAEVSTSMLGPSEALHPDTARPSADGQYWLWYQSDNNLVVRRSNGAVAWESGTTSADGQYWLWYQSDNNLVVRRSNGAVAWESGTTGAGVPLVVAMQLDGNLVQYVEGWQPVWDTGTAGHPGAWLALANDELTLRDPEGAVIWAAPLGVPLLTKETPAAGATVTGSAATFTWTAVAGESYRVCWDTTNNQACNGTWVEAGSATTLTVTGVTPGTYFWPFDLVDQRALRATLSERRGPTASRMGGK
jgi:hypothetical protein